MADLLTIAEVSRPQRRGLICAALLRRARPDHIGAHRLRTSPLSAGCAATHRLHCLRAADWPHARRDRSRARQASHLTARPTAETGHAYLASGHHGSTSESPSSSASNPVSPNASAAAASHSIAASSPTRTTVPPETVQDRAIGSETEQPADDAPVVTLRQRLQGARRDDWIRAPIAPRLGVDHRPLRGRPDAARDRGPRRDPLHQHGRPAKHRSPWQWARKGSLLTATRS